jgi:N-formylglutamate deformylase
MSSLPILILTPHNAGYVPQDILWDMLGEASRDPSARQRRLDYLFSQGDPYTDVIFHLPGAFHLHAAVSRFVVDLNRERNTSGSNGVVKITDFDATPLYPPGFELASAEIEERLKRYWDPFHYEIERVLREHAIRLLIDGHAMSPFGPAIGPDVGYPRPALSLMTGGDAQGDAVGHEPPSVAPAAARALQASAARHFAPLFALTAAVPAEVALNYPWSFDEISVHYSRPDRAVRTPGFGVEINRALYLETDGPCERPDPARLRALQRAFAAFAEDALKIICAHPLGGPV